MNVVKNNAWVTVNNDFCVMSEAICQRFSWVAKSRVKIIGKSHHEWPKNHYSWWRMYYFISYTLFYVLNTWFCLKQLSIAHFAIVAKDGHFWFKHCDFTIVDLWRHANARYKHCDIIFVNCSRTCKLVQRPSSLVNNNCEYWFLTTWYSWPSM